MGMYRKKPVIVEAIRLTGRNIMEVYEFMHGPVNLDKSGAKYWWDKYEPTVLSMGMDVVTLEDGPDRRAKHVASIGDYIIKGVHGEFYPYKPDIFHKTYEEVE